MLRAVALERAEIVGVAQLARSASKISQYSLLALVTELAVHEPHQVGDDAVVVEQGVVHVEQRDDRVHVVDYGSRLCGMPQSDNLFLMAPAA